MERRSRTVDYNMSKEYFLPCITLGNNWSKTKVHQAEQNKERKWKTKTWRIPWEGVQIPQPQAYMWTMMGVKQHRKKGELRMKNQQNQMN